MNIYLETQYFFNQTKSSIIARNTLLLQKKSLFNETESTIPLFAFSPEPKIKQKTLSPFAKYLLRIGFMLIIGIVVALFRNPEYLAIINVPLLAIIIIVIALSSLFYYVNATKKLIYFHFGSGQPAFAFIYSDRNIELKKWINEFNSAVINARIDYDVDNFIKISKGIDSLLKQNLISKQFALELQQRVNSLAETSIK